MDIKKYGINGYAALAPMAGVADRAMREICAKHGAAFTVGELTSAKGVVLGDDKSKELLFCDNSFAVSGSQLFGNEPEIMARATEIALQFNPRFIDINMGCPAPKVTSNGGGSNLMRDIPLAQSVVRAVVAASKVPVTVKMRTGWDSSSINAVELAKCVEYEGAAAITVHGRNRAQMYAPPVDYDTIKAVKSAVNIPVIANGDIVDGESAKFVYNYTGCDFVMVGRGAMGNPFIFEEINAAYLGKDYQRPNLKKRLEICLEQIKLMLKYKDKHNAILESRKHTAWYMNGIKGAASLRRMCGEISCFEDVKLICEKALEQNKDLW